MDASQACPSSRHSAILSKLEDRSTPMVFLGYVEGTKVYRLYDPRGDKVLVLRDVVFDEKVA